MAAYNARVFCRAGSDSDRFYHSHQFLEGGARELVSGALHMNPSEGLAYALEELHREYESSHVICNAYVQRFNSMSVMRNDDVCS